eukprot:TRINITY_DN16937_c0_g2_i1.p1 TRINITY_DN16937_c0_g2~~TRINITY_DN16937_c0_g2_i1.p1  ORF type:complete len:273 (+),score=55.24 TRINITY_DN16937_c0_g2_i1:75-893(+)
MSFGLFAGWLDDVQASEDEENGPSERDAKAQLNHDVQGFTALTVVSAVLAAANLNTLRSIRGRSVTEMEELAEVIFALVLVLSTLLSLYATIASSLLRYYGYAAISRAQGQLWLRIGKTAPMVMVKKTMFWSFIGSFILSLIEIGIITWNTFSGKPRIQITVMTIAALGVLAFLVSILYILEAAASIFAPAPPASYAPVSTREPPPAAAPLAEDVEMATGVLRSRMSSLGSVRLGSKFSIPDSSTMAQDDMPALLEMEEAGGGCEGADDCGT